MRHKAKRVLVLIGFFVFVAVVVAWWGSPAKFGGDSTSGRSSDQVIEKTPAISIATDGDEQPSVTSSANAKHDLGIDQPANDEEGRTDTANRFRNAPASVAPQAFEAEAQMLGPDDRGINIDASSAVLTSKRFERYMDVLATQASREPLAADLTKLYSASASESAKSLVGFAAPRVVCGLKVCLASARATSYETLTLWEASFRSNTTARTYDGMSVQLHLSDGGVEFRMVFGTDPAGVPDYPSSTNPVRP